MNQDFELSILVCTYNRLDILGDCLRSIQKQDYEERKVEVIVVNNYPSDNQRIEVLLKEFPSFRLIYQPSPGLSKARNIGIANSLGRWIGFIDDDAILPAGFIEKALEIIEEDKFDCFGGGIASWWRYGRPRWLSEDYGSKPKILTHRGQLINQQFNWGSNIFIRKVALDDVGGFPENIGMKGNKIGYAAENLVQIKLRAKGYILGFDPTLEVDHLVNKHKLRLKWHIKSAYATARDGRDVYPIDYTLSGYCKTLRRLIAAPIKGIFQLASTNYYWENWILDTCIPWAQLLGKLRSAVKS